MACFRLFSWGLINTGVVKQTSCELFYCGRTTCIGSTKYKKDSIIDKRFASYDAEGKTMAYVLDKRRAVTLCVKSVSSDGFKLHNDMHIFGSAIVFPFALFSWNVQSINDVTEESLTLFKVTEPKLELLILGYGRYEDYTREHRARFQTLFRKLGIRYEALPTEQAIGTFNFLSEDFRHVAGAFIPPSFVDTSKLDTTLSLADAYNDDKDEEDEPKQLEPPLRNSPKSLT